MALSIDTLVGKPEKMPEKQSKGWLRNTGLILAGAGLLSIISPSFADADSTTIHRDSNGREIGYEKTIQTSPGGDSTTIYYDRNGNEIGYDKHINTGPVQMPQWVAPPSIFDGKNGEQMLAMGKEYAKNKNWPGAEESYKHAALWSDATMIEGEVMHTYSFFMRCLEQEGKQKAKSHAVQQVNRKMSQYRIDADRGAEDKGLVTRLNETLRAFGTRVEKDVHPEAFSLEAYQSYEKGMQAYKKEDYVTASKLLRESVKKDPWSYDAWFNLASATYRKTGGNSQERRKIWEEGSKYHNQFKEKLSKF